MVRGEPAGVSPDIIYITRPGAGNSAELRYSLRTLANLPHNRVFVSGHKPDWCHNVTHIPGKNDHPSSFYNQIANLERGLQHPDMGDDVVVMNDDFHILQPTDRIPVVHKGEVGDHHEVPATAGKFWAGVIRSCLLLRTWGFDPPFFTYEMHMPFPIQRDRMLALLAEARRSTQLTGIQYRTLYGNYYQLGGVQEPDVKVSNLTHTWEDGQRFVSSSDKSFTRGSVGHALRKTFLNKSAYER